MPALTVNRFVEALSQSTALPAEMRGQLPELQQRFVNPRDLAQELLRRGWLTAYQINLIAKGRARELNLGPYVILDRLGEGGMGHVFKARQSSLHRVLALKVIRPECLANQRVIRRFLREIHAASQLAHPNVVRAYDAGQIDGAYYIAMEYVEGIDLAQLVKKSGPLPVWQACDVIRQSALGLQHAFEHGIVHRDIKPANLLMHSVVPGPSCVVKITDFGLARWTDDDPDRPISHLTQLGSVLGTPEFISPEQTRNSSTCDIRADLYSLGCTFYYLLAGQVPFPNGTLTDKLLAHQLDQAEPIARVRRARLSVGLGGQEQIRANEEQMQMPSVVEQVVVKLMAKQPQDRYQTPAELAHALASLQERLARGALPVPPQPQPETLVEFDLTPRPASPSPIIHGVLVASKATKGPAAVPFREPAAAVLPRTAKNPRRRVWPWILVGALAILPLVALAAGVSLLVAWSSLRGAPQPEAEHKEVADETPWNKLLSKAQKKPPPATLRHDLLVFRTAYPGSPHMRDVDDWLTRLPSPFDRLDRVMVPRVPLVTVKSPPELVGVLGEHRGYYNKPANIVAVSPDGRWLLGADEPALRLWDTAELSRPPARMQPHPKRVHAAVFSPDGRRLATAGDESAIRLWDPITHERGLSLDKHKAPVTRLTFSRDATLLASAGGDGKIWLWDPVTGDDRGSVTTGLDDVLSLAFSPDGAALAWGTATHVRWTRITGGILSTSRPSELAAPAAVRVLAFAPDAQTLLYGGGQGIVLAGSWDGNQLAPRAKLVHEVVINKNKQSLPVNQAVFSPDGKTIATAGSDHRVRIWDAASQTLQHEWDLQCPVAAAAFSVDGRHLITGNGNSTLTIFRLAAYTAPAAK